MRTTFKIIGGILAFVFCLLILLIELIGYSVFGLNNLLSEKKINRIIDSANITYLLEDEDQNKTTFYNGIVKSTEGLNLSEQEIMDLVNSTGFKNIIKELAMGIRNKYIYNSKEYALYQEEIESLVEANIDNMIANTQIKISQEDRNELVKIANNGIYDLVLSLPSMDEAWEKYPQLKYVQMIFDIKTKIAVITSVIVLTLLIALVTWNIGKGLKYSGIITIIVSFLVILTGLVTSFIVSYILRYIPSIEGYLSILKPVLKEIGLVFISNGLITFGVSIIMLILASLIIKKAERKEEQGIILVN